MKANIRVLNLIYYVNIGKRWKVSWSSPFSFSDQLLRLQSNMKSFPLWVNRLTLNHKCGLQSAHLKSIMFWIWDWQESNGFDDSIGLNLSQLGKLNAQLGDHKAQVSCDSRWGQHCTDSKADTDGSISIDM